MVTPRGWTESIPGRPSSEDVSLSEYANPECSTCHGSGLVEAGDECPDCIVGVWS